MRVLIVDVANVMGSRPDGWWRDRLGAATRLLAELPAAAAALDVDRIVAVVEGQARGAIGPDGGRNCMITGKEVQVVAAPGSGDDTIVAIAEEVTAAGGVPVVATADRGLRARLPARAEALGPRTLVDPGRRPVPNDLRTGLAKRANWQLLTAFGDQI